MRLSQDKLLKQLRDYYYILEQWLNGLLDKDEITYLEDMFEANFTMIDNEGKFVGKPQNIRYIEKNHKKYNDLNISFEIIRTKRIDDLRFLVIYKLIYETSKDKDIEMHTTLIRCNTQKGKICEFSHMHITRISN